jgi:hypothetical protein
LPSVSSSSPLSRILAISLSLFSSSRLLVFSSSSVFSSSRLLLSSSPRILVFSSLCYAILAVGTLFTFVELELIGFHLIPPFSSCSYSYSLLVFLLSYSLSLSFSPLLVILFLARYSLPCSYSLLSFLIFFLSILTFVGVKGTVSKAPREVTEKYFKDLQRQFQIGVWSSEQDEVMLYSFSFSSIPLPVFLPLPFPLICLHFSSISLYSLFFSSILLISFLLRFLLPFPPLPFPPLLFFFLS